MVKVPPQLAKYPEFSEESIAKIDKESYIITLVKGKKDDGVTPFYAFIKAVPSKVFLMRELMETGQNVKIEELGEVIKTGDTENPPPDVIQEMREKWNYDPGFEKKQLEAMKAFFEKKQKEMLMAKIAEMKKKDQK